MSWRYYPAALIKSLLLFITKFMTNSMSPGESVRRVDWRTLVRHAMQIVLPSEFASGQLAAQRAIERAFNVFCTVHCSLILSQLCSINTLGHGLSSPPVYVLSTTPTDKKKLTIKTSQNMWEVALTQCSRTICKCWKLLMHPPRPCLSACVAPSLPLALHLHQHFLPPSRSPTTSIRSIYEQKPPCHSGFRMCSQKLHLPVTLYVLVSFSRFHTRIWGNIATPDEMAWFCSAWLHLNLSPIPVQHPGLGPVSQHDIGCIKDKDNYRWHIQNHELRGQRLFMRGREGDLVFGLCVWLAIDGRSASRWSPFPFLPVLLQWTFPPEGEAIRSAFKIGGTEFKKSIWKLLPM